jgi:hypothetical protein
MVHLTFVRTLSTEAQGKFLVPPEPMVELTGDRETSTAIMPIAAKMYPDPIINSKNGYHES